MKVEYKAFVGYEHISKVCPGELFLHKGSLYLKTRDEPMNTSCDSYEALCLDSPEECYMNKIYHFPKSIEHMVVKVEGKLVVGG